MSTSAEQRFERLFANKPRPTKPKVQDQTLSSTIQQAPMHKMAPVEPQTVPDWTDHVPSRNRPASSSSEDEYVALFSKKANPRKTLGGRTSNTHDWERSHHEHTSDRSLVPIEFVPEGKRSAKTPKNRDTVSKNDTESYAGDGASLTGQFCPLHLVAKIPYKYMKDANDRVSKRFFASNKFFDRTWDLYFVHPPESFGKAALLLLPLAQVQMLINEISEAFHITISVPPFPFTLDFYEDGTPQPGFLGTTKSKEDVDNITNIIPVVQPAHGECPASASPEMVNAYKAFHDKIEYALVATKRKGNASNQSSMKMLQTMEQLRFQLKRAERYLGLRPGTKPLQMESGLSWDEEQSQREVQKRSCGLFFDFLDLDKPTQIAFDKGAVIVAVDVESYERNHSLITEIGVSAVDTLDLVNIAPGQAGAEWIKQIRSRHFRIKGREHFVNKDFCAGNPGAFQFGHSEFVSWEDVSSVVDSCFTYPFSAQFKKEGPSTPSNIEASIRPTTQPNLAEIQKGPQKRNVILLGHNLTTDITYLQSLNLTIFNDPSLVVSTLDTSTLFQTLTSELQPRSLSHICQKLGIDAWFTHNGGNDARYTLEALIKIVIQARVDEDDQQRLREPASQGITEDEWEAERVRKYDDTMDKETRRIWQSYTEKKRNENEKDRNTSPEVTIEDRIRGWNPLKGADDGWRSTTWAPTTANKNKPNMKSPRGGW